MCVCVCIHTQTNQIEEHVEDMWRDVVLER